MCIDSSLIWQQIALFGTKRSYVDSETYGTGLFKFQPELASDDPRRLRKLAGDNPDQRRNARLKCAGSE